MQRKIILFVAGILLALNIFAWQEVFYLEKPRLLKVDFLNVGQGDSAFIETPEGHQILIDGGPDSSVLEKLQKLMPVFDKSLDAVILTHPEKDHMMGLIDVLKRYKVDYVLWSGVVKQDAEYKEWITALDYQKNISKNSFLASLQQEETKIITVSKGTGIKAGNAAIDILFPLENLTGKDLKNSSNDTCLVSRLIYGKNSFLFTGDIDIKAEKELANYGIKSDVLKIAHHGSKYSTSDLFLQAVKPEIAIIEVGKNTYGHPTPEVLQRLENYDIKTFRTDQDGDVEISSDGNKIKIN